MKSVLGKLTFHVSYLAPLITWYDRRYYLKCAKYIMPIIHERLQILDGVVSNGMAKVSSLPLLHVLFGHLHVLYNNFHIGF